MSPEQDFVSAMASTKPWSHLRGVEEISPEVPLSFGIRKVSERQLRIVNSTSIVVDAL